MIDSFSGDHIFLSNFYPCSVRMYGKLYPSVEHAFQAAKTKDLEMREKIRTAGSAAQAKRLGRTVKLRQDWDEIRLEVMERLLRRKFENLYLRQWLDETKPSVLIEGNSWGDKFWGMTSVMRTTPWDGDAIVSCWDGENHLGRLLMEIRDE